MITLRLLNGAEHEAGPNAFWIFRDGLLQVTSRLVQVTLLTRLIGQFTEILRNHGPLGMAAHGFELPGHVQCLLPIPFLLIDPDQAAQGLRAKGRLGNQFPVEVFGPIQHPGPQVVARQFMPGLVAMLVTQLRTRHQICPG